jgi:hypothetical protein
MLGGMAVGRVVAAAYVAALLANAQVYPGTAHGHAFGADVLGIVPQVVGVEGGQVLAQIIHRKGRLSEVRKFGEPARNTSSTSAFYRTFVGLYRLGGWFRFLEPDPDKTITFLSAFTSSS